MAEGWVYLITNEAMPGYVKIGLTRQNDVVVRLKQLDNTAVPMPFECHFAARVPDCAKLEKTLHFVFGGQRPRQSREFFKIDPDLAKAIIELVAIEANDNAHFSASLTTTQKKDVEDARRRRESASFTAIGIPIGAELTFSKDPAVLCEVSGPKKVLFGGEQLSVSAAALKALRELGYDWRTVNGWAYWTFEGQLLADRWLQSRFSLEVDNID